MGWLWQLVINYLLISEKMSLASGGGGVGGVAPAPAVVGGGAGGFGLEEIGIPGRDYLREALTSCQDPLKVGSEK